MASTIVLKKGKLFLSYGGCQNAIRLTVRSQTFEEAHWSSQGFMGKLVEVANRRSFSFNGWSTYVRCRTFYRALVGHSDISFMWPQPVVQVELLHVPGRPDKVKGDYLTIRLNHAVADGFTFDKLFVSLMTAYEGKQLLSTGQADGDLENLQRLSHLFAKVPMPLMPFARLDPNLGGHSFWWGKVTGATIDRFRRESGSSTTRDTDIVIAMLWSAMRTLAVEQDDTVEHDISTSILYDIRSGVPGLDKVSGNLVWWSRPFVPERSQTKADTMEMALHNVDVIRKFRNGYSISLESIGDRVNASDSDDEGTKAKTRKSPIPGHSLQLALDPEYSTPYYCKEERPDVHNKPAQRRILAINDTTWLLKKFSFADPVTGVQHKGTSVAHPEEPNLNNWLPSLTFKLIPQKLAECKVWYVSLSRAHTNPAKLDREKPSSPRRTEGGSEDMQIVIIGGQEINES